MAVMSNSILYVDNTTLSAVASCDTKAMMQYAYNLKPNDYDNLPAESGSAIHKAIECYYMGGSRDEAREVFRLEWQDYALMKVEKATDRLGYANLDLVLDSWFERYPINELPYKIADPAHVEIPFDLPLNESGSIRYVGRLDARVQRTDGADVWYVLDTKTTGNPDTKFHKQFEIGSQMTGYAWAEWQLTGRMPAGIYINVVASTIVPTSMGKCKTHGPAKYNECGFLHPKHELKTVGRTPQAILSWHRDALRLAEKWRAMLELYGDDIYLLDEVSQNGKWIYQQCALCEFRDFCRASRPVDNENFEFIENNWVPGDLAERIANGTLIPDETYASESSVVEAGWNDLMMLPEPVAASSDMWRSA